MKLSVIVPTLNEAAHVASALESIPSGAELVVADGGSTDETLAIATRYPARIVTADRGRARQMNAGARASSGDALLFLHADCALGSLASDRIRSAFEVDDVVAGAFRLRIRDAGWTLKVIAAASNARARFLHVPYGDQALFVRRRIFEELGGFPEIPFLEDVAFIRMVRRRGKIVSVAEMVTTGRRHWQPLGPVPTTLLNWTMVTLYLLGVPAARLAPHYRRFRSNGFTHSEHLPPQSRPCR